METSPLPPTEEIEQQEVIDTQPIAQITHVDIRFSLALAVPASSPSSHNESSVLTNSPAKNKRTPETTKIQGYYRVEYSLIPGTPNVAFDIVVFRAAAKIYPDGQRAYVIPIWQDDNDNAWIVWSHIHKLDLNREQLLALLEQKILVKIWEGRDFCTVRTKLDKPRIGRLPANSTNEDDENSPKNIVQSMAQNYADKWIARPLLYKLQRKLPIQVAPPTPFLQKKIYEMEDTRPAAPVSPEALLETSMESLSGEPKTALDETTARSNPSPQHGILKKGVEKAESKSMERVTHKKGPKSNKQNEEKKLNGIAQIIIPSNLIFAGYKIITYRLPDDSSLPHTIQDCFASIKIEDPQSLHTALAKEFNPLTITICHVENMPSTPISYTELKQRCEPVYCSYQLFNQPVHQTSRKSQARHIHWPDTHVYLTNLIDESLLNQFRNSPILNIELHDRDECEQTRRRVGSVFGSENTDENIGRVSGGPKYHKSKDELNWHPYGCVRLDLTELWLGQTSLEFYTPVVPCHAPETHSGRASNGTHSVLNENLTIQQGDFLSSGTQMKIVVRLAKPLVPQIEHRLLDDRQLPTTVVAPFTRIVFIFSYDNTTFLTALQTCIRVLNAKALGFDHQPIHAQVTTLSTYKLTDIQQEDKNLHIITGFHLFDDEQHIFVLEGRKEEAIDLLYETVPKLKGQNVEILYDSSVHFNKRLYVKFGIDITHIRLSRTLHNIVSQPLIYVRDSLTKETFKALKKLHELVLVHKLNSSARHRLFPTMEMITSLNKDFGVPLTENEIKLFSSDDRLPPTPSRPTSSQHPIEEAHRETEYNHSTYTEPVKEQTMQSKNDIQRPQINFVARNMEHIRLASLKNKEDRPIDDTLLFTTTGSVYPYSSQRLNSTENALEQMRTYLKETHHSASCSFNPDYPSLTYSPYSNEETTMDFHHKLRLPFDFDLVKSKEALADKSIPNWIDTAGYRSSRQCNVHPKLPDFARLDELSKPPHEWYQQSIHDSQSPIIIREPCKWIHRKSDFDRWTQAPPLVRSISAHWQTEHELSRTTSLPSTSTVVVADSRMHFLRRSAQTEMINEGRLSASQLDRLTGILKDKPIKKGLLLPKSYTRQDGCQSAPLVSSNPSNHCMSSQTRNLLPVFIDLC
ncbi:unnamed protein product [Adineta ricciae]|uniref:DUF4550 domain-containing protein n=1 Tax=Adineta ricciae TaxID=249248 RepID=A0A814EVI9_ADIRI|nr:unnamed protein product [Adineta ricciae]